MATLSLTLKADGWERGIERLLERYPVAEARALNRAVASAKVVMVREVARDLGLKQSDLSDSKGDRITVRQAGRSEFLQAHQMSAQVVATGDRIPLYKFRARQTRAGVSARLPTGAERYPSAFIATVGSGHTGVFKRRSARRLPIVELFGPSVPKVFRKLIPLGLARGEEQLAKNLVHEMRFALKSAV